MSIPDTGEAPPWRSLASELSTFGLVLLGAIDVIGTIFVPIIGAQLALSQNPLLDTEATGWALMAYGLSIGITMILTLLHYANVPQAEPIPYHPVTSQPEEAP